MKRTVKRCFLKQACSANDSADPVLLFFSAAVLVSTKGSPISGRSCQIAFSYRKQSKYASSRFGPSAAPIDYMRAFVIDDE